MTKLLQRWSISALLVFSSLPTLTAADFLHSLPDASTVVPGLYDDVATVSNRLSTLPLSAVEGVWQMVGDGAIFAVERDESAREPYAYRMVMIQSPARHVRPGTVLGHVVATVKQGTYEARLYTDLAARTGLNFPKKFLLKVSGTDDACLTITPLQGKVRFNLWRLLPYMYRNLVRYNAAARPSDLDGAVRIYPPSAANPLIPRYL